MRYLSKAAALITLASFILFSPVLAFASTLSLDPSSGTFNRGCPFSLKINLDTNGIPTDGTDAILFYDNSRVTATAISTGSIYADYPGSNIDDTSGKVTISGLATVSQAFGGQGELATVSFTVKSNAPTGATQIKFDFDPNDMSKTTDSNVVERNTVQDTLSTVVNGTYTIGTGACSSVSSPSPSSAPVSGTSGGTTIVVPQGATGGSFASTPAAEQKPFQALPAAGGNGEWTAVLTILGSALTILGILGLALL